MTQTVIKDTQQTFLTVNILTCLSRKSTEYHLQSIYNKLKYDRYRS